MLPVEREFESQGKPPWHNELVVPISTRGRGERLDVVGGGVQENKEDLFRLWYEGGVRPNFSELKHSGHRGLHIPRKSEATHNQATGNIK